MALSGITSGFNTSRQVALNRRLIDAVINERVADVRKLLAKGADPSAMRKGMSALHYAAQSGFDAIVIELTEAGADINALSEGPPFATPLHLAARNDKFEAARLLILDGADINALDKFGRTPLHRAAFYGHDKVVSVLVAADANVALVSNSGYTAMDYAHRNGSGAAIARLRDGYSRLHARRVKSLHRKVRP